MVKKSTARSTKRPSVTQDFVRGREFRMSLNKFTSRVADLAIGAKDKALGAGSFVAEHAVDGAKFIGNKAVNGAQRSKNFARGFFS